MARRPGTRMTGGPLLAVLALACALNASIAAAQGAPRAAWAIGLPAGYVMVEHQASAIKVNAGDVARGVVEVREGSRLVITSDAPSGYAVDFLIRGTVFQLVEIDGISGAVELNPRGGTTVQHQGAGRRVVTINYRFMLAPGTSPGTYVWPLDLTVRSAVTAYVQRLAKDHRNETLGERVEP